VASLPIAMTCGMLVHDATYAVNFERYFAHTHHLLWRLSWVGMLPSVAIEIVLIAQWWRWTAPGLMGGVDRLVFAGLSLTPPAAGVGVFWFAQSVLDDRLDLFGFVLVQSSAVVFLVPWILSRGTSRGQSRAFAWATALGPASLGQIFLPYLTPAFRTWQCY